MRLFSLTLPATALLTLAGATAPALAADGENDEVTTVETTEEGPVEIVVETDEDGNTTKTVTIADDNADDAVVEVIEETKDGTTKKVVKIGDDDDDDDDDEVTVEVVEEHHHHPEIKWLGLHAGAIFSPTGANGLVSSGDGRLRSNQFKACADAAGTTACGYIKGLDLKVEMFETSSAWKYPTFVGYFRTGFEQGRVRFAPGDEGFGSGQAQRLDYTSVPLFLGGNVYLFDEFPVRPYGGMGFGFDVLRLDYRRAEQARVVDASARIGFELHAGLEVRISNYIALNAEVMQLWSARRKMQNLPDYSNTGMSVLAGVTIGIPVRLDRRGESHTVRKTRRVHKAD